ncbi:MAG: monooxygenase [Rhodobiaceae bacterium]|nr:monooxygenase [Rhodobiaceae bacterium]MCC0018359.1 monooxygenase [Rhodobiaceae bacterium]MCC0051152.1 monooxygenase [Rhodobiaceae bacterium]MCC0060217.1 monooxygenase [Rhodobiaceae bacterium]
MITAIVRFPLPAGTSLEEAKTLFEGSAPKYQDLPGLVRKYYLYDDGPTGGGVYLWESREAAEKVYTDDWKKMIAERYGTPPDIIYFESPVIVDNA